MLELLELAALPELPEPLELLELLELPEPLELLELLPPDSSEPLGSSPEAPDPSASPLPATAVDVFQFVTAFSQLP